MLPYEEWPQEYKDTRDSLWALEKEFRDKKAALLSELAEVEKGYVEKAKAIAEQCAERGHAWTSYHNYQEPTSYECVVCGAKADRDVDRPTYITFNYLQPEFLSD